MVENRALWGRRRNISIPFGVKKTRMVGIPDGEKKHLEDMYNRLDTIPVCDGQTDRQTDGQPDILLPHSPRYAYTSRGKNNQSNLKINLTFS